MRLLLVIEIRCVIIYYVRVICSVECANKQKNKMNDEFELKAV